MPKVSVIIPAFNRPEMLERAVSSVLAQTYADYELIVIDDRSAINLDGVRGLVIESGGKFLSLEKNSGPAMARNFGAEEAKGEYLAFLDSDDAWLSEKLATQIKFHEENPQIKISQCAETWYRNGKFVNPRNRHALPEGEFFFRSLELCIVSASTVMISRELFFEHGGFNENLRLCEDYDLWLRIAVENQIGLIVEELVEKFAGHDDQLSRSEAALDRYRVFSLYRLLEQSKLSDRQREAVLKTLQSKLKVLIGGAKKRNQTEDLSLYEAIMLDAVKSSHSNDLQASFVNFLNTAEHFKRL